MIDEQKGHIVRHRKRWLVRYWEHRAVGGIVKRLRISKYLGPVTKRAKHPPGDIKEKAERFMKSVNTQRIPAEQVVTLGDFAERVYLPRIAQYNRPSTAKSYRDIWEGHLRPLQLKGEQAGLKDTWLKDVRTMHVQGWLDAIGEGGLSRNTLKHIQSVISGMFSLAKQQGYFDGVNPTQDTKTNPAAREPGETHAYSLEEIQSILALLPEPAGTAFAVAAFAGLRHGEIQGLLWEHYRDGEIFVSRSIWNGRITDPKTRKSRAPVPVIKPLAERLAMHRLRSGNPVAGPIFPNAAGKPRALSSVLNRMILPALDRCENCGKAKRDHKKADHPFQRDVRFPKWHGWHAARRGLGSNLYRLGVPTKVIQAILRHSNVKVTEDYYIKTDTNDVRDGMIKLENELRDTTGTPKGKHAVEPSTVQ